jgi:hypothetical protein
MDSLPMMVEIGDWRIAVAMNDVRLRLAGHCGQRFRNDSIHSIARCFAADICSLLISVSAYFRLAAAA